MPNAARLREMGTLTALGTSTPPQSPVAWSNFITGANPGVHGIYDFIHRDPATFTPFLSTSKVPPPGRMIGIGDWQFPISSEDPQLLRRGPTFWKELEKEGVDCTLIKMPADFPPNRTSTSNSFLWSGPSDRTTTNSGNPM